MNKRALPTPNLDLRLAILRKYHSQSNFAYVHRIDPSYVTHVIHGRRIPPREIREKWAWDLGVGVETLFPGCSDNGE